MIWVNLAQTCDTFFVIPISFTAPEIFRYIFSLTDCNYTLVILVNFPNKSLRQEPTWAKIMQPYSHDLISESFFEMI